MLVLLNRLANSQDEQAEQPLRQLNVTARRESFSTKRSSKDLQRFSIDVEGNGLSNSSQQVIMDDVKAMHARSRI